MDSESASARSVASGALTQQLAQVTGLLVLLMIITVLARRLSLAEIGTYGLIATLSAYLLVLKYSVSASALRAMIGAEDDAERVAVFSTCTLLYAAAGVGTGILIAGAGFGISEAVLAGQLRVDAQRGTALLAVLTAIGLIVSVNLDAMRSALLLTRSAALEIASLFIFGALMLTLILSGAPLWIVIGGSGAIPSISGTLNWVAKRRLGLPFRFERHAYSRRHAAEIVPTAGWVIVVESSNVVIYALDRVVLGIFKSASVVGLYEGPVRAHNVLYALSLALGLTALPTAAGFKEREPERLPNLVVRGSRYSLALFVPITVTLIALAGPTLKVWLGRRYGPGEHAMMILASYWLLWGQLAVAPNFMVGLGYARETAKRIGVTAIGGLTLTLILTPKLGLEGPPTATTAMFVLVFPWMLSLSLRVTGAKLGDLARRAWLPAYALGAVLAVVLVAARAVIEPDTLPVVTAMLIAGPLLFWGLYWAFVLEPSERVLVRQVLAPWARTTN